MKNKDMPSADLTKREMFSMHAMSLIPAPRQLNNEVEREKEMKQFRDRCYAIADAMLGDE